MVLTHLPENKEKPAMPALAMSGLPLEAENMQNNGISE